MAINPSLLLGSFFLLLLTKPLTAHSSHTKSLGQSFAFLKNLEACHKGQTVKGLLELKHYLERFGYLNYGEFSKKTQLSHANDDEFDDRLESAIKAYQSNYHLKVTGTLDSDTIHEMMIPRCGIRDIVNSTFRKTPKTLHTVSHYSFFPRRQRWPLSKTRLTYQFRSSASVVTLQELKSVCSRAFKRWEAVSRFTFSEAQRGSEADIEIGFHRGFHGDMASFDGPGNTVAHAFAPPIGWFHYDADENWSTNPTNMSEADLESVAVHEIGHLLGLGHSLVQDAIMYPKFSPGTIKRNLHPDDIEGIRVLYS